MSQLLLELLYASEYPISGLDYVYQQKEKMKSKVIVAISFILFIALVALLLVCIQNVAGKITDETAERIIQSYIKAKDLNIQPNTEEYSRLMKGILLGEHQDLVSKTSPFIETQEDVDLIIDYTTRHMKKGESDKGTDIPEALNP